MWGSPGTGWVAGTQFLERNSPAMSVSTQFTYDDVFIMDPVVADFDVDGDFDMLNKKLGNTNLVRIYTNEQGKFTDSGIAFNWGESLEFADINNDGLYDVIVGGTMLTWNVFETAVYINQNNGTFNKLDAGIPSSEYAHARVADFDGDGDLDLLTMAGAFKNNTNVTNAPPSAPVPLDPVISGSSVKFQWQAASDDKTPVKGLTYNLAVRSEDGTIIVPAHALANGKRQIYKIGNAWNNLSYDLSCLKEGKYFWKVQSLDASYQGSAFCEEQSFIITKMPPVAPVNLTATPIADNIIDLHWTDASSTEDEFIIFRSGSLDPTTFSPIDTVTANATFYRDSLYLEPQSTYQYRVFASNCAYPDNFFASTGPVTTFPRAFVDSGWLNLDDEGSLALLGDIDRDQDLDLVISYNGKPTTKLFRFNGTKYEDSGIEFGQKADFGQWIDYNDDGYIDLLLSVNGTAKLYRNDNGTTFTIVENPTFPLNFTSQGGVSIGDYDNDGDDDLAVMISSQISLFENDGKGNFNRNTSIQLEGHLKSSNAWSDYDNDGDLDLLANKEISCSTNVIIIHENTSNNVFITKQFSELQGTNKDYWNYTGDMEWGDYDNDGYSDIIVAGQNTCGNGNAINRIYHNNKDKTFSLASNLIQLTYDVNVDWGDYDNDGDLDVFAYGDPFGAYSQRTRIYRNEGNTFRETNINYLLSSSQYGKSVRGDIDNDGDLDYVILGEVNYVTPKTIVYRNTYSESWGLVNHKPSAPLPIGSVVTDDQMVTLSWATAEDDETPQNGLTYNFYVVHQQDETIPETDSLVVNSYSVINGSRMIVSHGNVNGTTITLKNLAAGSYRWAIQSIDKGFAGSTFSMENSFVISSILDVENEFESNIKMYPNPVYNLLSVVSKYPDQSLKLRIDNIWGQHIGTIILDQPTTLYDMSFLPAGVYLASVFHGGIRTGLKKIIKQ